MKTIDNGSGEIKCGEVTFTFVSDYWMPTFPNKEESRKKRIEKILTNLNDKEGTKSTIL
jgi:hypothetical protein